MKIIRQGQFETNSSSSHSISIDNNASTFGTIGLDADGNVVLGPGEFGWEVESYHDCWTKATYCAIDALNNSHKIDMLKEVIAEHTGAKEVIIDCSDSYNDKNYSYIDHQSHGTSHEAFESKETLKNFIFGNSSYLYTDNDNH